MKKNTASQKIGAQMVSATDGSAFTGSVTVSVTGDAGTQATGSVGSGACTHEGNGYHTYAPAQAETNYDLIAFTFTGTGAVPATVQVFTSADANVTQLLGSATPVTNLNTIFNTDYATVYDATNKAFLAKLGNFAMGGSSLALTTGAIACTTITASGAVAFQSTFAVTTSTSLGALSCTTLTASGAVAFQSTFAVTTSTALAALSCTTLTASGAVAFQSTFATTGTTTFNAFTVTNALTVSGATTLTGAVTASNASNNIVGIDVAKVAGASQTAGDLAALINTVDDFLDTEIAAIKAKTDNLPSDPADASDIAGAFSTVNTTLATIAGYIDTEVGAIKAKTDNLPASPAAVGSAMTLTSAYDFAKGTAAMTEAYAANGVAPTPIEAMFAIHQYLMQFAIATTNYTVKKLDNSTTAFVVALDDATTPTGAARV